MRLEFAPMLSRRRRVALTARDAMVLHFGSHSATASSFRICLGTLSAGAEP
jgi:hypothetical protein